MAKSLTLDDFMIKLASVQEFEKRGSNKASVNRMHSFMRAAIERELTEKQRQYLIGYYIDGKKMRELAYENGVSESNVSKIIKRAINTLKARSVYLNIS